MEKFALSVGSYLRPGLDTAGAAAILQALCLFEVFDELVRNAGWPVEKYEAWLAQALKQEFFGEVE